VLMKGIVKANDGGGGGASDVFTFNNLHAGTDYDVLVYMTENGSGDHMNITDGTTTYLGIEEADAYTTAGGFINASLNPVGNYVEFKGLVGPSGTLTITGTHTTGTDGIGFNGLQILVSVPEPS